LIICKIAENRESQCQQIHAREALFVKIGKVLNLGNLYLFSLSLNVVVSGISSLGFRILAAEQRRHSTSVENPLQIAPFLQNKPNFKIGKMNATFFTTKPYENKPLRTPPQTSGKQTQFKAKTNPNKASLPDAKMNVTYCGTMDYAEYKRFYTCENKPNSKSNKACPERSRMGQFLYQ
jgi:hypothetical protein